MRPGYACLSDSMTAAPASGDATTATGAASPGTAVPVPRVMADASTSGPDPDRPPPCESIKATTATAAAAPPAQATCLGRSHDASHSENRCSRRLSDAGTAVRDSVVLASGRPYASAHRARKASGIGGASSVVEAPAVSAAARPKASSARPASSLARLGGSPRHSARSVHDSGVEWADGLVESGDAGFMKRCEYTRIAAG